MNVLLKVDEVSKVLRVTERTLMDWARQNELPGAVKIGKEWRFRRAVLETLIGEPWPSEEPGNQAQS